MSAPPAPAPTAGITVLGHHSALGEYGEMARSIVASLVAAGAAVRAVDTADESLAVLDSHPALIVVGPAGELREAARRHAALFAASAPVIGYWSCDLPGAPPGDAAALSLVDRVWVPTGFVAEAYRTVAGQAVELQPLYLPEPEPAPRTLSSFGVDAGFVCLTMFDHLDGIDRVNPLGVIRAFGEAFAPTADVALLVKTANGDQRPDAHARLLAAADTDDRIHVLDAHVDAADRAALLGGADCVVALHRSAGFPAHLAEAMWLRTPVIASRYGGNVDWMDDSCAALVHVRLVDAASDEAPPGIQWADPDGDLAADWMRRLAIDPALCDRFATAAHRRMAGQAPAAAFGQRIASAGRAAATPSAVAPAGVLQRLARSASSPVRNYINSHFEMTKQEVRALRSGIAGATVAVDTEPVHRHLTEVADVVAETGVHHARALTEVRAELSELRAELAELRADLGTLTEALIRAIEREPLDGE